MTCFKLKQFLSKEYIFLNLIYIYYTNTLVKNELPKPIDAFILLFYYYLVSI